MKHAARRFGSSLLVARPLVGAGRRTRAVRCLGVAEYTARWHWPVLLAEPGRPLREARRLSPGTGPAEVRAAWRARPHATALLPTGGGFDALDVPEHVGRQALARLERMAVRPGPVLLDGRGRALFLVAPDTAEALPQLLYRIGWDAAPPELRCRGREDAVAAPPDGPSRWLRPPTDSLPEARVLLGALAYVAGRTGAGRCA